jgi:hypothetical protein
LGYFSPRLNSTIENDISDYSEQANYIKLNYEEGEIDFIAASMVFDKPYKIIKMFATDILCENPLEIIGKKIKYRHENFAVRDFFDLATVYHYTDKSGIDELQEFLSPFRHSLQEKFSKLPSFEEIQTLPHCEIIKANGRKILSILLRES